MKKILRKAVTALRWTVVVMAVVVLALSGASTAYRLHDTCEPPGDQAGAGFENDRLLPGPPSPDEAPKNMTPSGKPNSEPYAYLSTLILLDFSNFHNRTEEGLGPVTLLPGAVAYDVGKASVRSTAWVVCSQLGLQFTLVGARPSGTS